MTHIEDIVTPWETRGDLIARGVDEPTATEIAAMGVFIRRTRDNVSPVQADADYMHGTITGRAYLEQVAPEELDR